MNYYYLSAAPEANPAGSDVPVIAGVAVAVVIIALVIAATTIITVVLILRWNRTVHKNERYVCTMSVLYSTLL